MVLQVIKQTILTFFRNFKSRRSSKLLYCFKSYGDFAEWVDFFCWWSCIRKGLRLQPAQQAYLGALELRFKQGGAFTRYWYQFYFKSQTWVYVISLTLIPFLISVVWYSQIWAALYKNDLVETTNAAILARLTESNALDIFTNFLIEFYQYQKSKKVKARPIYPFLLVNRLG